VFFLGLLSTPLPYLLLAAFYFCGFAMGMFNNSTGDEAVETISAVTIPVEAKQKTVDPSTFYVQVNTTHKHVQSDVFISEDTSSAHSPDIRTTVFHIRNTEVPDFCYSGFSFSRPPPSV
jgi:hypothetical protein